MPEPDTSQKHLASGRATVSVATDLPAITHKELSLYHIEGPEKERIECRQTAYRKIERLDIIKIRRSKDLIS